MNKGLEKLLKTGRSLESFTYQWLRVKCGKIGCKGCPHGPYLVARYRDGSHIRAIYIGKVIPDELSHLVSESK